MLKFEFDPEALKLGTTKDEPQLFPVLLEQLAGFAAHPALEPLLSDVPEGKCVRVTIEVADETPDA